MTEIVRDQETRKQLGYWASLEGIKAPTELLRLGKRAEGIGFKPLCASDHFPPWRNTDTYATFSLTWIASELEATERIVIGPNVTCPTFRCYPAVLAQAFASMDHMYSGRVFLGVGTGELLNEAPLGYSWPSYSERKERLIEAITLIRRLWREEFAENNRRNIALCVGRYVMNRPEVKESRQKLYDNLRKYASVDPNQFK